MADDKKTPNVGTLKREAFRVDGDKHDHIVRFRDAFDKTTVDNKTVLKLKDTELETAQRELRSARTTLETTARGTEKGKPLFELYNTKTGALQVEADKLVEEFNKGKDADKQVKYAMDVPKDSHTEAYKTAKSESEAAIKEWKDYKNGSADELKDARKAVDEKNTAYKEKRAAHGEQQRADLKNADKKPANATDAEMKAANDKLAKRAGAVKGQQMFGLLRTEGVGAALDRNLTFWKSDTRGGLGKGMKFLNAGGVALGGAMIVDGITRGQKGPEGEKEDRSWVARTAEVVGGAALVAQSGLRGRV